MGSCRYHGVKGQIPTSKGLYLVESTITSASPSTSTSESLLGATSNAANFTAGVQSSREPESATNIPIVRTKSHGTKQLYKSKDLWLQACDTLKPQEPELAKLDGFTIPSSRSGEKIEKVVKVVIAAKTFIGSTLESEPHAAIAWAGVSIFLPVKKAGCREGLEKIPPLIDRYAFLEDSIWDPTSIDEHRSSAVKLQLRKAIVQVYTKILLYEARVIVQFCGNSVTGYFRDALKLNNWTTMFKEMNELDHQCGDLIYTIDRDLNRKTVEKQQTLLAKALDESKSSQKARECQECFHWAKNNIEIANLAHGIWDIMKDISMGPSSRNMIFVLDALDECDASERKFFLKQLEAMYRVTVPDIVAHSSSSSLSDVLLESHVTVDSRTSKIYTGPPNLKVKFLITRIRLAGEDTTATIKEEINLVIDAEVDKLKLPSKADTRLRSRLKDIEHRTYLWLYLIMDTIRLRAKASRQSKTFERILDAELLSTIDEASAVYMVSSLFRREVPSKTPPGYRLYDLERAESLGLLDISKALLATSLSQSELNQFWRKETALTFAISNGEYEITELLINAGANINDIDSDEQIKSALEIALENNRENIISLLLDNKAVVNAALITAAQNWIPGMLPQDLFGLILARDGAFEPSIRARLLDAIMTERSRYLSSYLTRDVKLVLSYPTKSSPPGQLGLGEHLKLVRARGASLDKESRGSAFYSAIYSGNVKCVEFFLREDPHLATLYINGKENIWPLTTAPLNRDYNMVRCFLTQGADIDHGTGNMTSYDRDCYYSDILIATIHEGISNMEIKIKGGLLDTLSTQQLQQAINYGLDIDMELKGKTKPEKYHL
ncbi:hypothetical protein BHYA_0061g00150 [Botrytis hyacinthi]|uniref:Uncharacterized protein n=1 Tax=Botrytis hyacinthi TaxID=278943 RepID=A0A4Z1GV66_9HELO|nr:hypothetical protein BHYA_0061g00150 [Botrytis hyacinthi]